MPIGTFPVVFVVLSGVVGTAVSFITAVRGNCYCGANSLPCVHIEQPVLFCSSQSEVSSTHSSFVPLVGGVVVGD